MAPWDDHVFSAENMGVAIDAMQFIHTKNINHQGFLFTMVVFCPSSVLSFYLNEFTKRGYPCDTLVWSKPYSKLKGMFISSSSVC